MSGQGLLRRLVLTYMQLSMQLEIRPTHANLMYPGIGVGGYCLTKDPLLASWARKAHFGSTDQILK